MKNDIILILSAVNFPKFLKYRKFYKQTPFFCLFLSKCHKSRDKILTFLNLFWALLHNFVLFDANQEKKMKETRGFKMP